MCADTVASASSKFTQISYQNLSYHVPITIAEALKSVSKTTTSDPLSTFKIPTLTP